MHPHVHTHSTYRCLNNVNQSINQPTDATPWGVCVCVCVRACVCMYVCVCVCVEQGAILVFLPGWDDITRLRDLMRRDPVLGREDKFWVLPLHSGVCVGVFDACQVVD